MSSTAVLYDSFKKPQIDSNPPNPSNIKYYVGHEGENYTNLFNIAIVIPGFKRTSSGYSVDPVNPNKYNRANIGNSAGGKFVTGWYVSRFNPAENPFISYTYIGGVGTSVGNGLINLSGGYIVSLSTHSTSAVPCTVKLLVHDKNGHEGSKSITFTQAGKALFYDTTDPIFFSTPPVVDMSIISRIDLSITGSYTGKFRFNDIVIRKKI